MVTAMTTRRSIRERTIEGLQAGDTFSVSRTLSAEDMARFAEVSRDYNPVHFNTAFAREKKFSGKIVHGLLAGSLMTEIGGQIGWLATEMQFVFKRPVYAGDTIHCTFEIVEIGEKGRAKAAYVIENQDHVVVIEGAISGILPSAKERDVMRTMLPERDTTG